MRLSGAIAGGVFGDVPAGVGTAKGDRSSGPHQPKPRREWLEHRKTSHSLLAVGVSGACFGGLGWLLGRYVAEPVVGARFTTSVSAGDGGLSWWAARLVALDASTLGAAGMVIGAGAIVVHLLGDVITKGGLQPLLPFSRWSLQFSPLSYDNRIANNGLFALGVFAAIASLVDVLRTIGGF